MSPSLRRPALLLSIISLLVLTGCAAPGPGDGPWSGLTFMSYNIKHGRGMDGQIDLERIARVIKRENPDLLALQEVDLNCRRSGSRDLAVLLGQRLGMQARFGKFMDYDGGEYGMAVLSRLPIVGTARHELPRGAEPRCALEVQVRREGDGPVMSFVGIHNDWTNEGIRTKQMTALIEALGARRHPIILAGDFNGTREDASLKLLRENDWTITRAEAAPTFPSPEPEKEIDFFIVRGFAEYLFNDQVIEETMASDHRPITTQVSASIR